MVSSGRVVALCVRPSPGAPAQEQDSITLTPEEGVEGDHGARVLRQVTIVTEEGLEAAAGALGRRLGEDLPWTVRRANVLVRGARLSGAVGGDLLLGGCRIRIHGEARPCEAMDRAVSGLRAALKREVRGGIHGQVLQGGVVRPGDPVAVERPEGPRTGDGDSAGEGDPATGEHSR